jgi:hypothetical protein
MPRPLGSLVEVLATSAAAGATVRVGALVDLAGGAPWVEVRGIAGRVRARSMVPLDPAALASCGGRRDVVLLFEEGDPVRPIVAGFLEPEVATPALDAVLASRDGAPAPRPDLAEVDGRRVVIEGSDEVVLRCGEASITLRRNGKVVVRGLQVETHAAGTNRIKGGTVKIN